MKYGHAGGSMYIIRQEGFFRFVPQCHSLMSVGFVINWINTPKAEKGKRNVPCCVTIKWAPGSS